MRRTSYLGGLLSGLEAGSGRVALLVHGFPLDARMWDDQVRGLAGPDRRVVAVDLRGHGHSPWRGDAVHSMELLADDLAELSVAIGDPGIDVVGLSMGGYVALAMAERVPESIRSLALIDTRAAADGEAARAGRDATAAAVVDHGRRSLSETLVPKLVAPGTDEVVRGRLRTMIESQPYETIVADLRGMRDRADRFGVLGEVGVPVSVVVGELDALTPPADAQAMVEVCSGAEMVVVPGVGHMAPMEAPEAVNQALDALWERAGGV